MHPKRRIKLRLTILVAVAAISAIIPPVGATRLGVVFDDRNFEAGIPPNYAGTSDFDACEYRRRVTGGDHYQRIFPDQKDTCPSDAKTTGAPRKGDVSIRRLFGAKPDHVYKAWARGKTINPNNVTAQVKLIFWDTDGNRTAIGECYGTTTATGSFVSFHTAERPPRGLNGHPAPVVNEQSGGCEAPAKTDEVAVHYRIHSKGAGASGQAVLHRLRFGRCNSFDDCSNVPGF